MKSWQVSLNIVLQIVLIKWYIINKYAASSPDNNIPKTLNMKLLRLELLQNTDLDINSWKNINKKKEEEEDDDDKDDEDEEEEEEQKEDQRRRRRRANNIKKK